MKKFILGLAFIGLNFTEAQAKFYQVPEDRNGDGLAIMWISGNFEIKKSSSDMTSVIVLSSTGGIKNTYGIVTTTAQITGLLTGAQAAFSGWITASSGTFTSTMTASIVNVSTMIAGTITTSTMTAGIIMVSTMVINGVSYTFPAAGTPGNVLTFGAGGALTWTAPAVASSGGGSKNFNGIVVGTAGAVGVDAYVSNLNQFNLILASFNAAGLTGSTTHQQGTIYWRNGIYDITGATNPALTFWVCEDSVVFRLGNTAQTLITNYGTIGDKRGSPCLIDAGGLAFASQVFVAKYQSESNITLVGGQNQANLTGLVYPARYSFFSVQNSSWATGSLWFKEFRTPGMNAAANMSALATMTIDGGYRNNFKIKTSSYTPGTSAGTGRSFMSVSGSSFNAVEFASEMAQIGWVTVVRGSAFNNFTGKVDVGGGPQENNGGVGVFNMSNYQEGLTGCQGNVFGPMSVHVRNDQTAWSTAIFRVGDNGAGASLPANTILRDLNIVCDGTFGTTGIYLGADSNDANLQNVNINGCANGVVNSGTATKGWSYLNGAQTAY